MSTHIHHITVTTGHARRSLRSEISDAAIAALRPMLAQTGRSAIVWTPGYDLAVTLAGPHVLASVLHGGEAIASIGIASRSRGAATLWRALGAAGTPPDAPWCGVVLHPALALHADAAMWLGDFERCLAWAWLEMRNDAR